MTSMQLLDWMIVLAGINVVLCGLTLAFGFKRPVKDEFSPVEFDWRKEGF